MQVVGLPGLFGTGDRQDRAALRQRQRAIVGLDDDVPALRALLTEIEVHRDRCAHRVAEGHARGDGGGAVVGQVDLGIVDEEGARQDAGRDRQRVDPRIEYPESAGPEIQS